MTRLVPLLVRAELAAGFAHGAPWGIALDGLLAAELWRCRKASRTGTQLSALDQDDPPDLDLPLARCEPAGGPWHWAATCAHPDPVPDRVHVDTWTGRVDHRHLEQLAAGMPGVLSARQGRYRSRLMPLLVTPCRAVSWHAIGDPDRIRELLEGVIAIGKKRSQGQGHVLRWHVEPAPGLDVFTAAHLSPEHTLGRPTPAACLAGRTPDDGGIALAGIRPPYMHRSRQHMLHLPAPVDGQPA